MRIYKAAIRSLFYKHNLTQKYVDQLTRIQSTDDSVEAIRKSLVYSLQSRLQIPPIEIRNKIRFDQMTPELAHRYVDSGYTRLSGKAVQIAPIEKWIDRKQITASSVILKKIANQTTNIEYKNRILQMISNRNPIITLRGTFSNKKQQIEALFKECRGSKITKSDLVCYGLHRYAKVVSLELLKDIVTTLYNIHRILEREGNLTIDINNLRRQVEHILIQDSMTQEIIEEHLESLKVARALIKYYDRLSSDFAFFTQVMKNKPQDVNYKQVLDQIIEDKKADEEYMTLAAFDDDKEYRNKAHKALKMNETLNYPDPEDFE
jgi:hypothetical protein